MIIIFIHVFILLLFCRDLDWSYFCHCNSWNTPQDSKVLLDLNGSVVALLSIWSISRQVNRIRNTPKMYVRDVLSATFWTYANIRVLTVKHTDVCHRYDGSHLLPAGPESPPGGLQGWAPQSGSRYCMKDGSCSASSGLWYMVRLAWVRTLLRHGDVDMIYLQGEWHAVGKS